MKLKQLFSKRVDNNDASKKEKEKDKVMALEDVHSDSAENSDAPSIANKDVDWGDWSVNEGSHNGSFVEGSESKNMLIHKTNSDDTGSQKSSNLLNVMSEDTEEATKPNDDNNNDSDNDSVSRPKSKRNVLLVVSSVPEDEPVKQRKSDSSLVSGGSGPKPKSRRKGLSDDASLVSAGSGAGSRSKPKSKKKLFDDSSVPEEEPVSKPKSRKKLFDNSSLPEDEPASKPKSKKKLFDDSSLPEDQPTYKPKSKKKLFDESSVTEDEPVSKPKSKKKGLFDDSSLPEDEPVSKPASSSSLVSPGSVTKQKIKITNPMDEEMSQVSFESKTESLSKSKSKRRNLMEDPPASGDPPTSDDPPERSKPKHVYVEDDITPLSEKNATRPRTKKPTRKRSSKKIPTLPKREAAEDAIAAAEKSLDDSGSEMSDLAKTGKVVDGEKERKKKKVRSSSAGRARRPRSASPGGAKKIRSTSNKRKEGKKKRSSENDMDNSNHSARLGKRPSEEKKRRPTRRPKEIELGEFSISITQDETNDGSETAGNAIIPQEEKKDEDLASRPIEEEDLQRAEILSLQQQLSEALQKVVMITGEQIRDKDAFLKLSTEVSQLRIEFSDANREKEDYKQKLEASEAAVQKSMERIVKLEDAIERSLDEQDRLGAKLDQSEDDYEKLLIETQDLEAKLKESNGCSKDVEIVMDELKATKKLLVDKDREIEAQKHRIEHLEKELKDAATVNKLQVDELEQEKKALDGKLKGERLESQAKLAKKDELITTLQKELEKYKNDTDIQDLALVKAGLESAQSELDFARSDVERAERMVSKLKGEKEDLLERNNVLNEQVKVLHKNVTELTAKTKDLSEKVLQWTEKTYDWKKRAESAEKKLESNNVGNDSSDDGGAEETPQGLFLQSVMDKKVKRQSSRWNIFATANEENNSAESIRIKALEDRNDNLEETIAQLRSEMVKLKSAHKDELYSSQKKVAQLQGENDALALKAMTLEQLSIQE